MTAPTARSTAAPTMGRVEYGLIALQSMLWGSTFFFVALVDGAMSPITMCVVRLLPAVVALLLFVSWMGLRYPASLFHWTMIFVMAAFNNVIPFVLITIAQREVTGGIAAVFNATAPLFAVFFAAMFIANERLSWRRVAGIVAGICGVAVLIGAGDATASLTAKALLLLAASCYASANVLTRLYLSSDYPPFVIASAQMIASLVLAAIAAAAIEQPWQAPMPEMRTVMTVFAMGIFGSALASLCHFTVLARAGPTNALLVTIILPLTPIILGAVFLGDRLSLREGVGAAVIALALVIIDGRLIARLARVRA